MQHQGLAHRLVSLLGLDQPPVALAFVEDPPAGVDETEAVVPSACTFWRDAERGVFYAPVARHLNCAVGAMTMGFALPAEVEQTLGQLAEQMVEWGYLDDGEAAGLPSVGRGSAGIVYGPLDSFPLTPDAVLVWLTPRQAMVFNEAVGHVQWTGGVQTPLLGRPSCAALPMALRSGGATLSLGCIGMRTFTAIPDDRILAAYPGKRLGELGDRLAAAAEANARMEGFYASQLAALVND